MCEKMNDGNLTEPAAASNGLTIRDVKDLLQIIMKKKHMFEQGTDQNND